MELRHLRYFVAVATEGSLTRAAERLHLTQPSLSRQIRQLERDIGAPLLERASTGTTLTPAGVALHSHAVVLLRLADATRETTHAAARRTREVVDIGIPPGLSADWLIAELTALDESVPHAAVTLTEASSTEQLRMVRAGRLDLGLVHEQPVGSLRGTRLFAQPFGVAVRPGHRFADDRSVRLRDLDGVRILAHGRQQVPVAHDRLVVAAHDAGAVPQWQFAQFSEHALACAEATKSDAVLLTEHSAARLLPGWPWRPVVEPELDLVTWLVWPPATRAVVDEVARQLSGRGGGRRESS